MGNLVEMAKVAEEAIKKGKVAAKETAIYSKAKEIADQGKELLEVRVLLKELSDDSAELRALANGKKVELAEKFMRTEAIDFCWAEFEPLKEEIRALEVLAEENDEQILAENGLKRCPDCSEELPFYAKFCTQCGHAFAQDEESCSEKE